MTDSYDLLSKYENDIPKFDFLSILYGVLALKNNGKNYYDKYIKYMQEYSLGLSRYFNPILKYMMKEIDYQTATNEISDYSHNEIRDLRLLFALKNRENLNRFRKLVNEIFPKFQVNEIFNDHQIFIFAIKLVKESTGEIMLLIYAILNNNKEFTIQLLNHLKHNFIIPILYNNSDNCLKILQETSLDNNNFRKQLMKLLLIAIA
jgi:hypothetical protein